MIEILDWFWAHPWAAVAVFFIARAFKPVVIEVTRVDAAIGDTQRIAAIEAEVTRLRKLVVDDGR